MRKSSPQLFRKLEKLLDELREHPYTEYRASGTVEIPGGCMVKTAGQEEPYQVYGQRDYRNCVHHFSLGAL